MNKDLIIKRESVINFLTDNLTGSQQTLRILRNYNQARDDQTTFMQGSKHDKFDMIMHTMLKSPLYIKKVGFEIGDKFTFELPEKTVGSEVEFETHYVFFADAYDGVSFHLRLNSNKGVNNERK